jgi:hypothetical protein
MPKSKAKPKSKARTKAKPKAAAKPKGRTHGWTEAKLMRLAPETPRQPTREELLYRIKTLLKMPDTPKGKARRS